MALALDGSAHNSTTGTSVNVTLSTSNADDLIQVSVTCNGGPVVSVTATGLSFSLVKRQALVGGDPNYIELWQAVAASALSSKVITVTQTSSAFIVVDAWGVTGANTSSPSDTNASNPTSNDGVSPPTLSTDTANTFIVGCFALQVFDRTQGAGWTLINTADFQTVQYKVVSATQTNLSIAASSDTNIQGIIGYAVVQASGGASVKPWWLDTSMSGGFLE